MNCTIPVAKIKALISFTITVKLICVFVFTYAKCWFSHDAAHFFSGLMLVTGSYDTNIVVWDVENEMQKVKLQVCYPIDLC